MMRHVPRVLAAIVAMVCPLALADEWSEAPHGFFLTWREDPTSTMVVQWLEEGRRAPVADGAPDAITPLAVPRVDNPQAGVAAWWDQGLVIDFLADPENRVPAASDLSARARVAWNDQALHVAVRVEDDVLIEHESVTDLWRLDSVELFLSDQVGSNSRLQLILASGAGADGKPRHHFNALRNGLKEGLKADVRSELRKGGYTLDVKLPWSNLPGYQPAGGRPAALQIVVNDVDAAGGERKSISLFPSTRTYSDPSAKQPLILAAATTGRLQSRGELVEVDGKWVARVLAAPELAGQTVRIMAGTSEVSRVELKRGDDVATAMAELQPPPADHRWGEMKIELDGRGIGDVRVPGGYGRETPKSAELRYWPDESDADSKTVSMQLLPIKHWAGRYIQRVELKGLKPDTLYRFDAKGRTLAFRTMPQQLHRPLRIAFGGDTRHSQAMMERTSKAIMRHEPDLIVWGGDLAYDDADPTKVYRWNEWFKANDNTIIREDGRIVPIVLGIGNHEVRGHYITAHPHYQQTDEWRMNIAPQFYQFFAFPGQPGYGVLDFGDYMSLVVLDTDHSNPIPGAQTQWLERVLAERKDRPNVFPIYHVPAYPSHRPFDGEVSRRVRENWTGLFDQYGIRLAFEHHDHTYKRTIPIRGHQAHPDGIVYMGDGAWGVENRPVHDAATTWYLEKSQAIRHGIMMSLEQSGWKLQVISEKDEVIDELQSR